MAKTAQISFKDFRTRFSTEADCRKYMFEVRFPDRFICPKCGYRECYYLSMHPNLILCANRKQTPLHVSQSYVSKQISKLEEEWQVQLFHWDHHRVILTPAGEYMRNFFVRYQQELVTALKSARSLSSAAEQRLRIGVFSHLDFRQGPEIIHALRAEAPGAEITMDYATEEALMVRLLDHKLDLIVTNRDSITNWVLVDYQEISRGNYFISVSADAGVPQDLLLALSLLEPMKLITLTDATISIRTLLRSVQEWYGFAPQSRTEVPNLEALHRMVESGMGYAFIDSPPNKRPPEQRITFLDTGIPRSIGLAWRREDRNPLLEQFRSQMHEIDQPEV